MSRNQTPSRSLLVIMDTALSGVVPVVPTIFHDDESAPRRCP